MKIRVNVKGLVSKYKDQIAVWRGQTMKASWKSIRDEICALEGVPKECYPTEAGVTRAWNVLKEEQGNEANQAKR